MHRSGGLTEEGGAKEVLLHVTKGFGEDDSAKWEPDYHVEMAGLPSQTLNAFMSY